MFALIGKCRYLPKAVCQEVFAVICLSPAMITDLRTRPDLLITSSDASAGGAGIAATAGLSDYGVWSALTLPQELPLQQDRGCAEISFFGGIEAGRRACDLLGVALIRHVAVEIDPDATRAVGEVYPDVIHYRDVVEFVRETIHNALAGVNILFVLLICGFQCQGLSGANPTKTCVCYGPRGQFVFRRAQNH